LENNIKEGIVALIALIANENGLKWTEMDSFCSYPDSDLLNQFLSN